ncbi:MAG: hypothetical protein LC800_22440, partial [Acidobacteria bacterium]|nr:hypothetical protein [Acidobacteriota bacterium]
MRAGRLTAAAWGRARRADAGGRDAWRLRGGVKAYKIAASSFRVGQIAARAAGGALKASNPLI